MSVSCPTLRFTLEGLPDTPWKNGGGTTREIARMVSGGEVLWRISLARIERPGPFSAFPGIWRQLMLLEGEGLVLDGPDPGAAARLAQPYQVHEFDGAARLDGQPLGGACRVLNLMTRRDAALGSAVHVVSRPQRLETAGARACVLIAHRGGWTLTAPGQQGLHALAEGEGMAWLDAGELPALQAGGAPSGALLVLTLRDARRFSVDRL
ncbi:HutD/Ves family protein [Bordetella sp. 2513F-2]